MHVNTAYLEYTHVNNMHIHAHTWTHIGVGCGGIQTCRACCKASIPGFLLQSAHFMFSAVVKIEIQLVVTLRFLG